jgi:hypothetical protein
LEYSSILELGHYESLSLASWALPGTIMDVVVLMEKNEHKKGALLREATWRKRQENV